MPACDRAARYIEFKAVSGHDPTIQLIHTLEIGLNNRFMVGRVLIHEVGLVSTLNVVVSDLQNAVDLFHLIPTGRQIQIKDNHVLAFSYMINPEDSGLTNTTALSTHHAVLDLRFACGQAGELEMRVDCTTGASMPADVRLIQRGVHATYLREALADESDIPLHHRAARTLREQSLAQTDVTSALTLPDDLLAVLGAQWRPLVFQGDHWKGTLRKLPRGSRRTSIAENFIVEAMQHLGNTLSAPPEHYQTAQDKSRWKVFVRRLQPLMLFLGILALMPVSWLLVSSGTMGIHPLALGLTPLLMVGVIVLTAREIPVMEIPPRPKALSASAWQPAPLVPDRHNATPASHEVQNETEKV